MEKKKNTAENKVQEKKGREHNKVERNMHLGGRLYPLRPTPRAGEPQRRTNKGTRNRRATTASSGRPDIFGYFFRLVLLLFFFGCGGEISLHFREKYSVGDGGHGASPASSCDDP